MDFQRPQGPKTGQKFSPLQIHRFHPFELKFLLWVEGPNRGVYFFFFEKFQILQAGEPKY